MARVLSYVLWPWYGEGAHPDAPPGGTFAQGRLHDYRISPARGWTAQRRLRDDGAWVDIQANCGSSFSAAAECGRAEKATVAEDKNPSEELLTAIGVPDDMLHGDTQWASASILPHAPGDDLPPSEALVDLAELALQQGVPDHYTREGGSQEGTPEDPHPKVRELVEAAARPPAKEPRLSGVERLRQARLARG